MNTLPDKPSELIKVALTDLKKAEQDPRYTVRMNSWHSGTSFLGQPKCEVCLAGAVMAFTLGVERTKFFQPSSFPLLQNKLLFLNRVRVNYSIDACIGLLCINRTKGANKELPAEVSYDEDKAGFYQRAEKVIKIFKGVGL